MVEKQFLHFVPLCLCAFVPCVKTIINFKPAYEAKHLPQLIEKILIFHHSIIPSTKWNFRDIE